MIATKALSLAALGIFSTVAARPHGDPLAALNPSITWGNCTEQDPAGLQCGQMAVPIDYSNPQGETINITLSRIKANGTNRLGSLIYNPGGPGSAASTVIFALALQGLPAFSSELTAQYDIIGFDPRGVGLSTPVKCDPEVWNQRVSSFPKTEQEYQQLVAYNKALGESCAKLTGSLINHLDTIHVVNDLELARRALNEGNLNFFGASYGSQIAAQYAERFPGKVNRFVLDSVEDHTLPETATLVTESATFEMTLNKFFSWCNSTSDCALNGQDAATAFDALIAKADAEPISAPGCSSTGDAACRSNVTGEEILNKVQSLLAVYSGDSTWPEISLALASAIAGNATDLSTELATAETFSEFPGLAIGCQDWLHDSSSLADVLLKTEMTAVTAPHTRGVSQSLTLQTKCIGWPAPLNNPQTRLRRSISRAPKMLLVNPLYDPSTSIAWANGIHAQIANSVLVTRNGAGHTSYLVYGETSKAIDTFLLTGETPSQGTVFST